MRTLQNVLAAAMVALLLFACGGSKESKETVAPQEQIEVSIDSLLVDASGLDGKIVKFVATVDHACVHGGKRLSVFGSIEGKILKIESAGDGQKFDGSLMGKRVEVIGKVKRADASHESDCDHGGEEGHDDHEGQHADYVVECISYREL